MPKAFEPPKYISSLIAAINDGARTAQTGALALAALSIYLAGVAVSTSNEDLLLGHTTTISQLGVQVSPEVSFGIAPWYWWRFIPSRLSDMPCSRRTCDSFAPN
jgi:hypothetical protein